MQLIPRSTLTYNMSNCSTANGWSAYVECLFQYYVNQGETDVSVWESDIMTYIKEQVALIFGTALLISPLIPVTYRSAAWYVSFLFWTMMPSVNADMLPYGRSIAVAGMVSVITAVYTEGKK